MVGCDIAECSQLWNNKHRPTKQYVRAENNMLTPVEE